MNFVVKMARLVFLLLCTIAIKSAISEDTKPAIPKADDPKAISGTLAAIGQFPWQAALFFEQAPGSDFWFCSGSIISENWILTSAHCAHSAQSVLIYAGIIDLSLEVNPTDIAKEFVLHKDFKPDSFNHDIALIKLTKSLSLDKNVATIPLSSEDVKVGTRITVSGWGKTKSNDSSVVALLNYVKLTTVDVELCGYGDPTLIPSNVICANVDENLGQVPCQGDSGGPAVAEFEKELRHVGIVSFVSDQGCESGLPTGYTKTTTYLNWIKENTGI